MNTDPIDLKIDFAFKRIFGREGQEPVLVAFLNAVLKPKEGKQIRSLSSVGSGERRKSRHRKIRWYVGCSCWMAMKMKKSENNWRW